MIKIEEIHIGPIHKQRLQLRGGGGSVKSLFSLSKMDDIFMDGPLIEFQNEI